MMILDPPKGRGHISPVRSGSPSSRRVHAESRLSKSGMEDAFGVEEALEGEVELERKGQGSVRWVSRIGHKGLPAPEPRPGPTGMYVIPWAHFDEIGHRIREVAGKAHPLDSMAQLEIEAGLVTPSTLGGMGDDRPRRDGCLRGPRSL